MLVLSRKPDESILIDGHIRVRILGIRGNQVRIGIEAPGSIKVIRTELIAEEAVPTPATAPERRTRRDAPVPLPLPLLSR